MKNLIYVTVTALNRAILVQWQSTGVKVFGSHFLSAVHGFACTQLTLALTEFVLVAPVQYFGNVALNREVIYSAEAHVGKYEQLCSKQQTHI